MIIGQSPPLKHVRNARTIIEQFNRLKQITSYIIADMAYCHWHCVLSTSRIFTDTAFCGWHRVTSDSIRELKHLLIANAYPPDDEAQKNLIPFLIEQFQFVETLELGTKLALPLQCPLSTSLRRLRSLRISVRRILTHDGKIHNIVEGPNESVELRRRIVHDTFLEAFAGIVKKPEILLEKDDFDIFVDF